MSFESVRIPGRFMVCSTHQPERLAEAKEKWLRDNSYSCFSDTSEETFDAGWNAALNQAPEVVILPPLEIGYEHRVRGVSRFPAFAMDSAGNDIAARLEATIDALLSAHATTRQQAKEIAVLRGALEAMTKNRDQWERNAAAENKRAGDALRRTGMVSHET